MNRITAHQDKMLSDTTPAPHWGVPDPTHDPYILAAFQPRPTDILIVTAPKAGTTWMQQILHQLRSGGDSNFIAIDAVVPWLEFPRPDADRRTLLAQYEALPDPRAFKTHCTYEQAPGGVSIARIVLSSRDPRDCCLSFYHHLLGMTDAARASFGIEPPASFEEHVDQWLAAGAWYRNVRSWWPYHNHPNLLWLCYEDMKADLGAGIERIRAFLGWPLPEAARARVLEHCSFAWMKAHDRKFTHHANTDQAVFKPGAFIRKGEVGDHRTLMTAVQGERILARAREELPAEALCFLGLADA
jgi:Sulfotransferase domain